MSNTEEKNCQNYVYMTLPQIEITHKKELENLIETFKFLNSRFRISNFFHNWRNLKENFD